MKWSAVSFLISTQNPDGGWGYDPQQSSAVEPTSAVLLALREDPSCAQLCRRAIAWLQSAQNPDGGWGFNSRDKESGWQTAWAVLALCRTGQGGDVCKRGIKWLLSVKTLGSSEDTMQAAKKLFAIDLSLHGWPWLPGEATWIEPTVLALLALESIPDKAVTERINEALRYIRDRRCEGGGWNVGNPVMFSKSLLASVHTTALVLLALIRLSPGTILPEDIEKVRSEMDRGAGTLGLAWGLLALKSLGKKDRSAEDRLAGLQDQNGGWKNSPYKTACVLMAHKGYL